MIFQPSRHYCVGQMMRQVPKKGYPEQKLIIGDRRKDVTYLIMEETNLMSKAASEVRTREKKRGRV